MRRLCSLWRQVGRVNRPTCWGACRERRRDSLARRSSRGSRRSGDRSSHECPQTKSAERVARESMPAGVRGLRHHPANGLSRSPVGLICRPGCPSRRSQLATSARRWRQRRNLRNRLLKESTHTQPVPQTSSAGTHCKQTSTLPSTKGRGRSRDRSRHECPQTKSAEPRACESMDAYRKPLMK